MLRVVPATRSRLVTALNVLYFAMPPEERAVRVAESAQAAASGELDLSRLLLAEFNGEPIGALVVRMQPSDVAFVWPPIVSPLSRREPTLTSEQIEDALLQAAVHGLDESNAHIAQSLLELNQSCEGTALLRNGFNHLTDLKFFERPLTREDDVKDRITGEARGRSAFIPYRRAHNRLRFANVIEQTYRGSLDCPEMNGIRSASQSLKVYEAAGPVAPNMWRLYREGIDDAGVMLIVERSDQNAWEVIYLGVIESARRKGIARTMLKDALQAAHKAQVERVLIVVDTRNLPAIRLYESLGFTQFDVRAAYVRLQQTSR